MCVALRSRPRGGRAHSVPAQESQATVEKQLHVTGDTAVYGEVSTAFEVRLVLPGTRSSIVSVIWNKLPHFLDLHFLTHKMRWTSSSRAAANI